MAAVAAVGLLGSFGDHGSPIGFVRMIPGLDRLIGLPEPGTAGSLHDGDGGVYWLLVQGLPGFRRFRFPGKLLTFVVLGLSALAARGWDSLASGDPRERRRASGWSGGLLALTLPALGLSVAFRGAFLGWLGAQTFRTSFGPLDAPAAVLEAQRGLAHAALALAITLTLALRIAGRYPATAAAVALSLTAADLALANARMVVTLPQSSMDSTPEVWPSEQEAGGSLPVRV